jgi:GNAT superfamily N-acetyltransferase
MPRQRAGVRHRVWCADDAEQTVRLAHRAFPGTERVARESWAKMESGDHVTFVAEEKGHIVGMMPFALRDLQIRPGVSLRAAFAHLVAVEDGWRSHGLGSAMMAYARTELRSLCDGLFVYTIVQNGHSAYNFYKRNGLVDLQYSWLLRLDTLSARMPDGVVVSPWRAHTIKEVTLRSVYQKAYADYAGFPVRKPEYWSGATSSIIFEELPQELYLATCGGATELQGYGIFGVRGSTAVVLELAVLPGDVAHVERLLQGVVAGANGCGADKVEVFASQAHPIFAYLFKLGFRADDHPTLRVTAGRVENLKRAWLELVGSSQGPSVRLLTDEGQIELEGEGALVRLRMAEPVLHRLFLCREDIGACISRERIASPDRNIPIERLEQIFRPAPWIYHHLDWI